MNREGDGGHKETEQHAEVVTMRLRSRLVTKYLGEHHLRRQAAGNG